MILGQERKTFVEFWEALPDDERIIVDVLRQIILQNLPEGYSEKVGKSVPFYSGKKRVCVLWPASVPRGGVRKGVLLGFCQGYRLKNPNGYIYSGTNKRIYYRIIKSVDEIDEKEIVLLLSEAIELDRMSK